ncbi:MAG: universal stress protein [Acidobacteriaceae bacterium]
MTKRQVDIRIKTILVATDFTDYAYSALCHAISIAHHHRAGIVLLHVIDPLAHSSAFDAPFYADGVLHIAAEQQLNKLGCMLTQEEIAHHTVLREGLAPETILRAAREYDADLLVLGSHGRGRIDRIVLGSVAERIVRASPCPVMVVGPQTAGPDLRSFKCERILFPTDLRETSISTAETIAQFAAFHGASLTLLHVLPRSATHEVRAATSAKLHQLVEKVRLTGASLHGSLRSGAVDEVILSQLRDGSYSVLALGLCDKKDFHQGTPAGLAYNLISKAACPVFTFRKDYPFRAATEPIRFPSARPTISRAS